MGFVRFIFGGGWWTIWHVLMLLSLLLNLPYHRELTNWTLRKTGEPAAGMGVWMGHFMFSALPWIFFSCVNGLLLITMARGSFLTRSLLVFNLVVILTVLSFFLSAAVAGRSYAALLGSYGVSVLALGVNLWMLWFVRERGVPDAPAIAGKGLTIGMAVLPGVIIALVVGAFVIIKSDQARDRSAAAAGVGGRERAEKLVRSYVADHWHNTAPGLNEQGVWVGLYGIRIHYDDQRDVLTSFMDLHTDVQPENFDVTVRGINDPAIGGMFDHRNATIQINEPERTIVMTREIAVAGTSAEHYSMLMDDLWQAARFWRDGYLQRIPAIDQGTMPPPEKPLTIEEEWEIIKARG